MSTSTVPRPHTPMTQESNETKALATRQASDAPIIRSSQEFVAELDKWHRANYHVLSPFANFSALPPHWGILPTKVTIDPDASPDGPGEVYQDGVFTRGNDVAIAKLGLAKIARAAGMTIKTERTDPRTVPNVWEVRATARFVGINGTPQELDATEEWDLRDGSERVKQAASAKQIMQSRIKGLRNCESRACNAAVRSYGIKQKYSKEELRKPFVVIQMIYLPDMTNPVERQQVTDRALAGTTALYPGAAAARPAPELLDVIGATESEASAQPAKIAAPQDRGLLVVKVEHDMEAASYDVTLEGGEVLTTQSADAARAAMAAKKAGARVRLSFDAAGCLSQVDVVSDPVASKPADAKL
jgi:hypothetical protein